MTLPARHGDPAAPIVLLRSWAPLLWFTALAVVLTFVTIALVRPPGPLDDPAPSRRLSSGQPRDGWPG